MKLNEICEVYSGYALKAFNDAEDGLPVIKIGNIFMDGTLNLEECQYTTDSVNEKYYSQRGDIYIALSGATTGKIGIMDAGEKYVINQRVGIVRQKSDDVPQEYIKYFLLRQTDRILQEATGCAQPNISPKQIAEYVVPDTSQEKMQEICEVLDRIKKIIDSRKAQISALDDLIKARFVEMFSKINVDWKEVTMADICKDMRTGPFGSALHHDEFVDKGIFVLGIDNAVENKFSYNRMRYITEEKYEKLKRYTVHPGDVIITIMGTVGRSAVIPENMPKAINTKHLACLTPDTHIVDSYFLVNAFQVHPLIRKQLESQSKGAIMNGLNLTIIKGLKFRLPPLELQKEFVEFYKQVDKSKVAVQNALDETQKLFNSLMQQFFG